MTKQPKLYTWYCKSCESIHEHLQEVEFEPIEGYLPGLEKYICQGCRQPVFLLTSKQKVSESKMSPYFRANTGGIKSI